MLAQQLVDVAPIDLRLDDRDQTNQDGMILVKEPAIWTAVPVVVTASSDMKAVRAAMRAMPHAYILKDELGRTCLARAAREPPRPGARSPPGCTGSSVRLRRLWSSRRPIKVAAADVPVLISDRTGSGKELVARSIHTLSSRRAQPLVTVNCGAFTEALVESQLFGYEQRFFTGADRAHAGYLETGSGTTLDECRAASPAPDQAPARPGNKTYRTLVPPRTAGLRAACSQRLMSSWPAGPSKAFSTRLFVDFRRSLPFAYLPWTREKRTYLHWSST